MLGAQRIGSRRQKLMFLTIKRTIPFKIIAKDDGSLVSNGIRSREVWCDRGEVKRFGGIIFEKLRDWVCLSCTNGWLVWFRMWGDDASSCVCWFQIESTVQLLSLSPLNKNSKILVHVTVHVIKYIIKIYVGLNNNASQRKVITKKNSFSKYSIRFRIIGSRLIH